MQECRQGHEKLHSVIGCKMLANAEGLMNASGERTNRGRESGEHTPAPANMKASRSPMASLEKHFEKAPFKQKPLEEADFTFIDLFAGIGGIRYPFQKLNGHCVFTSEWDKFAQKTYLANYGEMPNGDITQISAKDIKDHDILLGGFPCQAFSQAGLKQGFSDTRGTMFFEIQRILTEKKPKAFLLENVKQLQGHDKGRTLKTITDILRGEYDQDIPEDVPMSEEARHALSEKLNYWVSYKVLRAADFGVPQNRERIFIVGFDKDYFSGVDFDSLFMWPEPPKTLTRVGDILEPQHVLEEEKRVLGKDRYTISDKLWEGHKKRSDEKTPVHSVPIESIKASSMAAAVIKPSAFTPSWCGEIFELSLKACPKATPISATVNGSALMPRILFMW